jgi:iron complex transport system substrate-binding protein
MSPTLRRFMTLSLAALAATAITSCSSSASPATSTTAPASTPAAKSNYPFTIENCGRTYTYTQAPTRVLVGWPKTVETLAALGVGSTVTGYISNKFGPAPQGVTAKALSTDYTPSAETILSAKPDFFLANGDSQLSGSRGSVTPDDLSKIGANAYVMGNDCKDFKGGTTVDTVYQDITNLGRIFNVPDKAAALNSTLRARVAAAAGLRGSAPAPRIAYVSVYEDKLYALSGLSYAAQVEGVGGVNVLADPNQSFGEISSEKVLTLDVDAIVFVYNFELETIDQQKSKIVKVLGNSRAVRNGKIVGVPNTLAEGPGVAVVEAIELIAKTIYG